MLLEENGLFVSFYQKKGECFKITQDFLSNHKY